MAPHRPVAGALKLGRIQHTRFLLWWLTATESDKFQPDSAAARSHPSQPSPSTARSRSRCRAPPRHGLPALWLKRATHRSVRLSGDTKTPKSRRGGSRSLADPSRSGIHIYPPYEVDADAPRTGLNDGLP